MTFTDEYITTFVLQYLIPVFRIGAMFMVMPILGAKTLPTRIRLYLSIIVAIIVVPVLPELPKVSGINLALLPIVLNELLIGVATGFVFQIAFQVFVLSGQYMAMQMGLGFASMNDPANGVQTTVLSQFFLTLVTILFLAVDGHLVMIEMLVKSFYTLPPSTSIGVSGSFYAIAELGAWMFASALLFALPVITSLLFVNIAFGIMSKAAPQLNIFAVGFPFTLVSGLFLVWLGLSNFYSSFEAVMFDSFQFLNGLLGAR